MNLALISESTGGLLWIIWFASSVLIGLGSVAYFRVYPDINLKRRFHRWFTIAYGAGFFLLIILSMGVSPPLLLFGAGIAVITYLNLRNTIFCDACGKTTYNYSWFSKIEYCARCGARLPQKH
jgi:ribosomal protein L37E